MYFGSFVNVTQTLRDIHKGYAAEKDSPRISKAIVFLMVAAFTVVDFITIKYFMLSLFNEKDQTASMLAFVLALILDACPSLAGLLLSRDSLRVDKKQQCGALLCCLPLQWGLISCFAVSLRPRSHNSCRQ